MHRASTTSPDPDPLGTVTKTGLRRGTCEVSLKNLSHFSSQSAIISNTFGIGGYRWKLAISKAEQDGLGCEMNRVFLLSCNNKGICADISLTMKSEGGSDRWGPRTKWETKLIRPFGRIGMSYLPSHELLHSLEESHSNNLPSIVAHFKHVKSASDGEQQEFGCDSRTVDLKIIRSRDIMNHLNGGAAFGLFSHTIRNRQVNGCSCVNLWANHDLNYRYWLCSRCEDGNMDVKRCLNKACILECFDDIETENNSTDSVLTVFEEEKNDREEFQQIFEDTILVFVKVYEPPIYKEDLTYCGHRLVGKTTHCMTFLEEIARDMAELRPKQRSNAYLEEGHCIRDITLDGGTLEESNVRSGSIVIIRGRAPNERVRVKDVQQELRHIDEHKLQENESSRSEGPGLHWWNFLQNWGLRFLCRRNSQEEEV